MGKMRLDQLIVARGLAASRERAHALVLGNHVTVNGVAITKAGGAIVQEAIAAGCPLLINQVIPGQEEGNATLVEKLGIGAVAANDDEMVLKVGEAFRNQTAPWRRWRQAIQQQSRPDAALRIAEFILQNLRFAAQEDPDLYPDGIKATADASRCGG
ncbi:MAG: hypothetical protein B7X11_00850 [Acidobacteria bacterium 37-65-4]|nr:MAG: hypothetical protein B7X11_00850 [Acidobacteria bacterium 37-65-4]